MCICLCLCVCVCVCLCVFIHCLHKNGNDYELSFIFSMHSFGFLHYLSSVYHHIHTLDQSCDSVLCRHTRNPFWSRCARLRCAGYYKGNHINQADLFLRPTGKGFVWRGELVCSFGFLAERSWVNEVQGILYSTRSGAHSGLVTAFVLYLIHHYPL